VILIDPMHIEQIDAGISLRVYDESYWTEELRAAKERAYGPCIARMAESLHYVTIPVQKFLDIGTGPGFFLDAVRHYMPRSASKVYGVEKFPPSKDNRSISANYITGSVGDGSFKVDCGICVEVIEHLTPEMLRGLLMELASVSSEGALYIFNSGQPAYVKNEDPGYLDPLQRGHIASYSVSAVNYLGADIGFRAIPIPGKTWAMGIEFGKPCYGFESLEQRIWHILPENRKFLIDSAGGTILQLLGLESARAYH
jgi:hypothetical protein